MKFIFLISFLFSCNGFCQSSSLTALLVTSVSVETDASGTPRVFPGGTDEKYFAHDELGNRYKLRLKNLPPLLAEVGASELIESIGLANLRVLPIIAQRGVNNLPSSEDAKILNPSSPKFGLAGKQGFPFQATAQRLVPALQSYDVSKLNSTQLLELSMHVLINYLVGNHDMQLSQSGDGNIGFDGQSFYTLDITQAFKFYSMQDTNDSAFDRFFSQINIDQSSFYNQEGNSSWTNFLSDFNIYLSRLENLSHGHAESFFGAYQASSNSFQRFKNLEVIDYTQILMAKIAKLRGHLNRHLTGFSKLSTLPQEVPSAPNLNLSLKDEIPNFTTEKVPALLLAFFNEDHPGIRGAALKQWGLDLNVEPSQTLSTIKNAVASTKRLEAPSCKALLSAR